MSGTEKRGAVRHIEHTGITVSSLDTALEFWVGVMGFEQLVRKKVGSGSYVENIVGVPGADLEIAVLGTPGGHKIELLQYSAPSDQQTFRPRSCDIGSAHLAFIVSDFDGMLARIEAAGWSRLGVPQIVTDGPRAGEHVVYVRGPEGHTIELFGRQDGEN